MPDAPHDPHAEVAVLAACLHSPTAVTEARAYLDGTDFYRPAHEAVWDAIAALDDAGEPVDPITVPARMTQDGTLTRSGGLPFIADIVTAYVTAANVRHHARIVREHATRRRLMAAGTRVVQVASGAEASPEDLVATALEELQAAARPTRGDAPTIATQVDDALDAIDTPNSAGWSWPWTDVRRLLIDPTPGQFIIFAARPGVGKSITLIDIARHVAIRCGRPVVLHSLEMSTTDVLHRIFAAEARVPLGHIKANTLTEDEWGRLAEATTRVRDAPLTIIDDPSAGAPQVRAAIRQHKPAVVLFDYFQIGRTNPAQKDRRLALEEMSRTFKLIAKEEQVVLIAAAQVNRKASDRTSGRPVLTDLRETGSLEQDCDTAVLIHRDDVEEPECSRAGEVDMIIAKQRNGPQGSAILVHQLAYQRFVDMAA